MSIFLAPFFLMIMFRFKPANRKSIFIELTGFKTLFLVTLQTSTLDKRQYLLVRLFCQTIVKTSILLRSDIPSGICAKLRAVAASNNRDHPTRSLYYCLFAPHTYIFVLRAHPVRGESYNQRNTTGEVATTSPPFYNEPHRSHVLCVKVELCTTSTSWSQYHFVAIGNPERHVRKASHYGSKQQ